MQYADVIVVGAGVLGTFHAYFAARKGYRTLLIERNAHPCDASARNFGIIAPSIVAVHSAWATYARDTAAIYQALQQEHDITVEVMGSLYLASSEAERRVLEEFVTAAPDYTCAYLDGDEACYRYPVVQASYCRGALLFPDDLALDPRRMLHRLIPFLADEGVFDYQPLTTVVAVEASGQGCIVRDAHGNLFGADRVIVCSGAEYRTLFPGLIGDSGLRFCKLQMMQTVALPPQTLPHAMLSGLSIRRYPVFQVCPSFHILTQEPVEVRLQEYGIHLLLKQAPDGGIVIGDSHQYSDVAGASTLEEWSDAAVDEAILDYGRRMVTLPSWQLQRHWNGYYLTHPESAIYTRTVDEAIHVAIGIGGKGMTTGPGFARHNVERLLA